MKTREMNEKNNNNTTMASLAIINRKMKESGRFLNEEKMDEKDE